MQRVMREFFALPLEKKLKVVPFSACAPLDSLEAVGDYITWSVLNLGEHCVAPCLSACLTIQGCSFCSQPMGAHLDICRAGSQRHLKKPSRC